MRVEFSEHINIQTHTHRRDKQADVSSFVIYYSFEQIMLCVAPKVYECAIRHGEKIALRRYTWYDWGNDFPYGNFIMGGKYQIVTKIYPSRQNKT